MRITNTGRWMFCGAGLAAILCLAFVWGWSYGVTAFAAVTALAICLWISDAIPGTIVAMLLPVAYIFLEVGTPAQILSPWTTSMCWLVLGGVVISKMMERSGVSRRMALWAIKGSGASLKRLLWGIILAGFLIAPFVPTAMGKAALFVVILGGICTTLEFKPGSREAACIFLCGILALAEPKFLFFTSSVDSALLINTVARSGMSISFMEYFVANAVPGLVYTVLCVLLLGLLVPKSGRDLKAFVEEEYAKLGPVSAEEKKAFLLLGLVALAMVTDSWHHKDIGWVMMAAAGLCFMPGFRLLGPADVPALPLGIVFFVAGCMVIGTAAQAVGVDSAIGGMVKQTFPEGSGALALFTSLISGTSSSLVFTTLPSVSTLVPALTSAGLECGASGKALLYAYLYGLDQFIMPYVFAPALYFYASGYIPIRYYLTFQSMKLVMTLGFFFIVAVPWWSFIL